MSGITFRRITPYESRIYQDDTVIGEVYREDDILNPGQALYIVHLSEDPRGWIRVHDRARIREVAEERVRTHPLWS